MMMGTRLILVLYLVLVSGCLSFTWSSSINSIFKSRSFSPVAGVSSANLVESIASGVQLAMDQCQTAFKWDKWNCPQNTFSKRSKQLLTRETAYSKAIVAAGIVYAITRNCSRGELKGCTCDSVLGNPIPAKSYNFMEEQKHASYSRNQLLQDPKNSSWKEGRDWTWSGCSDDPSYATEVSRSFMDHLEKGSDAQAYVSKHNNRVGREIVKSLMVQKCRCHGVSGSCSVQTCIKEMAPFAEIAEELKAKYHKAIQISFDQLEGSFYIGNSARHMSADKNLNVPEDSLIYLDTSPNYCKVDTQNDWPGTKGRACSKTNLEKANLAEKKSCRNICRSCGYKVKKQKREVMKRCNCSFTWCCEVKCDTCIEILEEFHCD